MFNKPQRHRGTEKPIFYNEEVTDKLSILCLCASVVILSTEKCGNLNIRRGNDYKAVTL